MKELIQALCNARKDFKPVGKNGSMDYKGRTHGYATLGDYITATHDALAKNGIYILQAADFENRTVRITTRILHISGDSIEHTLALPITGEGTAQTIGSAITYGKRYSIAALLYLDGEVDEDGNVASNGSGQPVQDSRPTYEGKNAYPPKQPYQKSKKQTPKQAPPPPLQPVYAADKDLEITETIRKIVSRVKPDITDEKFMNFAQRFNGLPINFVVKSAQDKVNAWAETINKTGS